MTISYTNTFSDRLAFVRYHFPRSPLLLIFFVGLILQFTFYCAVPAIPNEASKFVQVIVFIVLEGIFIGGFILIISVVAILSLISRRNKTLLGARKITLGEEVIITESSFSRSEIKWPTIQKLARTSRYVFLYVNQASALVIPRRDFEPADQWEAFYAFCKRKTENMV